MPGLIFRVQVNAASDAGSVSATHDPQSSRGKASYSANDQLYSCWTVTNGVINEGDSGDMSPALCQKVVLDPNTFFSLKTNFILKIKRCLYLTIGMIV